MEAVKYYLADFFAPAAIHLYLKVRGGVRLMVSQSRKMLQMRQVVEIFMPLVMFKYNSALVDRPTQLIEQRTQQVFLLCVQVCFCSLQFKRRAFVSL